MTTKPMQATRIGASKSSKIQGRHSKSTPEKKTRKNFDAFENSLNAFVFVTFDHEVATAPQRVQQRGAYSVCVSAISCRFMSVFCKAVGLRQCCHNPRRQYRT